MRQHSILTAAVLLLSSCSLFAQTAPAPSPATQRGPAATAPFNRTVPKLPAKDQKIRVLIDSDAANEVDDQYAIALALLSPEKFKIEGFVATHFGDSGGPNGTARSEKEIHRILEAAGLTGKFPVKKGSDPMLYSNKPQPSEGADFIIERAKAGTPEDPLWIITLGAATNTASAYLKDPSIADRVVVLYHGRTHHWPEKAWNFNIYNDLRAFRALLRSRLPLVLFDTGTDLTLPMAEVREKVLPTGPLGKFLHDIRTARKGWSDDKKGLFDLGDISCLVDTDLCTFEETVCPDVEWDMKLDWKKTYGKILRIKTIDRDGTFNLLFKKLANPPKQNP